MPTAKEIDSDPDLDDDGSLNVEQYPAADALLKAAGIESDEDYEAIPSIPVPRMDEVAHVPAGSPEGGQFASGNSSSSGGIKVISKESLKKMSATELSASFHEASKEPLSAANGWKGSPERQLVMKELKARKLGTFEKLEQAVRAEKK